MRSHEMCQCEACSSPHGRVALRALARPAVREGMCVARDGQENVLADHAGVTANEAHVDGAAGCALRPGDIGEIEKWVASYVRTRLLTMAGEAFSISRSTVDHVAKSLHEHFLSDADSALQRILDFAALRCLYEDSATTVTLDDVRVALCSAAPLRR